jgi:eukaryotic-like serine/threonine-protein kinase
LSDAAPVSSGGRFGPYRPLRLLGQGAAGQVHLAADERLGGWVALKLVALPAAPEDAAAYNEARARFLVEAYAAQQLRHPHIASVLAAGEEAGRGWIAMELAPGAPLLRYATPARRLPEAVVLRVAASLCAALAHAHAAGIVHRDLKPANVMVDWGSGSLKLTDFGLARTSDATATRTGVVVGSPGYLAPEQLAGAPAEPRTDLYALGVLMFELLAGRRPFEAQAMGELLRQVALDPAPDLRQWAPDVSAQTADLVRRLLAKAATERPGPAAELTQQLDRAAAAWVPAGA